MSPAKRQEARRGKSLTPQSHGVITMLESTVDEHRHETALSVYENGFWRSMSYAETGHRSKSLCAWLREKGYGRGDRMAILSESKPEWGIAFFATVRSGAIAVPLDTKLTVEELVPILQDAQPGVLFTSSCFLDVARRLEQQVSSIRDLVFLEDEGRHGVFPSYRELKARSSWESSDRELHEVAVLTYTSGTTGEPKGVMTTFENLIHQVTSISKVLEQEPEDKLLSILPLHHLFELTAGLLSVLWSGSEICYCNSLYPQDVLRAMRDKHISRMIVVPLFLKLVRDEIEREVAALPRLQRALFRAAYHGLGPLPARWLKRIVFRSLHERFGGRLRYFVCGGAPLDPDIARFFARIGLPIFEGYGLTETSPVISTNTPVHNRIGSVGKPLPSVEVRILKQHENDREGEILTRGPHVMKGYHGREYLTREVIDSDGWLHTGDIGRLDRSGYLYVTGRIKSMIVLGSGKKVQPEEVEQRMAKSPAFGELCIVGVEAKSPPRGERKRSGQSGPRASHEEVCAVIVPAEQLCERCEESRRDIEWFVQLELERLARSVAPYKRPTVVLLRTEPMPRTSTGKVKRALVREWALSARNGTSPIEGAA